MKKPAEGSVRYEKPLPLELLPYVERTDLFRSVGTAFALGNGSYVTAAHVLSVAVDSQYGPPAIRASDGSIHLVSSVLNYSAFEDFAVFSVADDPKPVALPVNRSPHLDDPVLAVGNALGEGIVIRDGLFTSETPEEQDGRWKWIRFSAAASPGNSGGPLLDAAGNIIGVVIRKSPSENLNYALPIANVLDSPQSKARFDQRALTKLPFAQGSRTYALRDEFTLPLRWAEFASAFQTVVRRHADQAREALLSGYAATLFPKGSGTEDILYGRATSTREPAVVIQQSDDNWVVQAPELRFTDLGGDGRVGIGPAAGAILLVLHRGEEASDAAFYGDSKSFMDIALKALDVRRPVGTDQVRVVSLGSAVTDAATTDAYGRKWQLRVWAIPFLDIYLVGQLLATPDGYVALLQYGPSVGLREAKAQLALLANQVTLTYAGTLAQWQAFLSRHDLLPRALADVTLGSGPAWRLHTHRFETAVPTGLMKMDSHSELLVSMDYMMNGSDVVWDIGAVWWYANAQERAYMGLWRQPRPPATAKLELRSRFEDLQGRRSPYDGFPVQASSDAVDISTTIQAPGSREGLVSSDLVYGLTLRVDGHPTPAQVAEYQKAALQDTHILERSIGHDVAASAPATLSAELDARLRALRDESSRLDQAGRDIRGRVFSEDFEEYLAPLYRTASQTHIGSREADELRDKFDERARILQDYWRIAPGVVHNRDLWRSFLLYNHLAANTPHDAGVLAAEARLTELLGKEAVPTAEWTVQSETLQQAYVDERGRLAGKVASGAADAASYRKRISACPEPASRTSGGATPRPGALSHSLEEFYPRSLRAQGIEGMVILSVKVDRSGCVTDAAVTGSSGSDELDDAALRWAEAASFLPAEKDGRAAAATGPVGIAFKLAD